MGARGESLPPLAGSNIEFRVQRHDEHELGNLTPEGREHARELAEKRVAEYLDKDPQTNFMVIASDQIFDETEPSLGNGGMRARQTAEEIIGAITQALSERGLPADQLFGASDDAISMSPEIREADIFNNNFMKSLKDAHSDASFGEIWQMYYQDTEKELRESLNAESSAQLALRMDYAIKTAEMVAASFYKTPGKENQPLVVWMVGHGGGIDSYLHHYAGVPVEKVGFAFSEGFTIRLKDGEIVAEVKGEEYNLKSEEKMSLPDSFPAM